jgi:hypothetical protein
MKKITFNMAIIALIAISYSGLNASTLKITNQRQDGLGIFVAADYGAPLKWHALDPRTSTIINSGVAKIRKVMWYDSKNNVFWETNIDQPGIMIAVGDAAGTFTIDQGPAHRYVAAGNVKVTERPRVIQWSVVTYK